MRMKVYRSGRYGAAIGALASLITLSPAQAQTVMSAGTAGSDPSASASLSDSNSGGLQEVVVTAQFRSQRLQDTPIAITAMTAEGLEARGQTTVADIGNFAPNVNISPATSANNNGIAAFIRGVGQSSSSFAFEPGVGIYIDDVYYGTTFGANLDLTDLDRVEVLRGPQGTLAGKNSVGGAVKLFSKKPTADGGGFVEVTYGSFNRVDLRASGDFKVSDDWFVRVSGVSKKTDGFFQDLDFGCAHPGEGIAASPLIGGNCAIGTEGGIKQQAIRLAIRYAPDDSRLEVNLVGDYNDDQSEAVASKLVYANNPGVRSYVAGDPNAGVPFDGRFITGPRSYTGYATFANGGNYTALGFLPYQELPGSYSPGRENTAQNYGVAGTVNYALTDHINLVSITAYRDASGFSVFDPDASPLSILLNSSQLTHQQFTQELRATGTVSSLLDFTVGGFYYDAHDRIQQRIDIPSALLDFVTNDPVENTSKSLFAHTEFHLFEGFDLIGGVRYTKDSKDYTFHRQNPDGTLPSGVPLTQNFIVAGLDGLVGTYSGTHVDYRVGADYRFNPGLMVYGQVSTGYKGGGVNPTPYVADQVVPFGPETLTTYEIGLKSDLFDRILRLNADIFYNRYKNLQESIFFCPFSVSTTCALTTNAGNANVKGSEFEVTLRPIGGLTLNASVGYLDFNYSSVNSETGIAMNMKAPFNSKWQASGGVEYSVALATYGTLTPRFDVAYQSSFYYNPVNDALNKVDGRSIASARLAYESANQLWGVNFQVTNLFDKFYYTGANENQNYGVATDSVGAPREWSVTVRRKF